MLAPSETTYDTEDLLRLIRAMKEFSAASPDLTVSKVITLLSVAADEGKGVVDYAGDAGFAQTTMTRHLLDLGQMNRRREPGLGLLVQRMNPIDLRQHQTFLTPIGKALVNRAVKAAQGKR